MAFYFLDFYHKLMEIMRLPLATKEKIGQGRYATLHTRLQIRDTLNMLCSLIIVLRTSDDPIRLNRIGRNSFEHLFGKTRIRCREINTMKRFVSGLVEEFLKLQSSHFLELIAVPKKKTSIGIDCEPWSQLDPSASCSTQGIVRVRCDIGRPSHPSHLSRQRVEVVGDLH
jgi:hypothetical protein